MSDNEYLSHLLDEPVITRDADGVLEIAFLEALQSALVATITTQVPTR